jgi:phosphoglycolate phosphatase-like HAD superfamily hydrolase
MWGSWTVHLAGQLRQASGIDVHKALYNSMGYDEVTKKVRANGKLAAPPMAQLYRLTVEVMLTSGLSSEKAEHVVAQSWCIPDPILLAKPFTDTRALFANLHSRGIKIAIATADDRAPTQAMIEAFDIDEYITTMVCADDGIPSKPAPDMVLTICERMQLHPSTVMVIGDTISDLKMARSAGAGLAVGVLSGVSSSRDLAAHADLILESVDELHLYVQGFGDQPNTHKGLNPDFAF